MLGSSKALWHFAEVVAALALLALAYGTVRRRLRGTGLADLLLGLLFGLAAVLSMSDPVTLQPGVIIDLRAVPVALAAAYLRPAGAVMALSVAVAMRLNLGGIGAASGVAGLFLSAGACLVAGRRVGPPGSRGLAQLVLLGLLCSTAMGGLVFLPREIAVSYLANVGLALLLCNVLAFVVVARIIEREHRLLAREDALVQEAETDVLTGLLNRRGFEAAYATLLADRRTGRGSALMLLDMDHFKALNDGHGHAFGDKVLREVAGRLRRALRQGDLVGRIGGEEMVIAVTDLSQTEATETAERLCRAIAGAAIPGPDGTAVAVTVSIGVHWSPDRPALATALQRADGALYEAKRAGRDRAVLAA